MAKALLTLMAFDLMGGFLGGALHLPIPGAVIGMLLLAAYLGCGQFGAAPADGTEPAALDRAAGALLTNMGLLFVPAGVGIVAQAGQLGREWKPILVAVVGSTVIGLAATGLTMHWFIRKTRGAADASSEAACRTRSAL